MPKKMLIDATHEEETRVVVVDGNKVEEFDFESVNKKQLAGNIHLARVTRVEPSLQAAFVDYGGNRHGFLAFSEIHPDYYRVSEADRRARPAGERAQAGGTAAEDGAPKKRSTRRRPTRAEKVADTDALVTSEDPDQDPRRGAKRGAASADGLVEAVLGSGDESIAGMDVIDVAPETDGAPGEVADPAVEHPEMEEYGEAFGAEAGAAEDDVGAAEDDDGPSSMGVEDESGSSGGRGDDPDIESVSDDDISEEIERVRKHNPRHFKIQDVIKVRQVLLVQVVKEERGNKGAALTTYLSLPGRYCVLMPNTARGGGISRKITNATDRKKLKDIADDIVVPDGAGLIIRTAGAKRTKAEVKRDYEYLQRLWEQIRGHSLKAAAPAPIYEEGNLIKRSIRDLYDREIDEVIVDGEQGHHVAKDFMKMLMPSHAKNVKFHQENIPLFARYQVDSYLAGMFNPKVQLKSGGYIVIGITEALVAIDVNSGRATKEASVEDTALKTNLEAAEEVARQLRLRDLAGLIVIDFIDMDERKNNAAVEKRFKDKLKTDRARIQIGRISGFGLLEMSRQRLRPGMLEASTQPCHACHGTGLLRSSDSLALQIIRQIEEEGVRRRSKEVLVKVPVDIANYMMNQKREHISRVEARYGLSIRIEGDPLLLSPDFSVEKFKTATRIVPERAAPVVSVDMDDLPELEEADDAERDEAGEADGDQEKKKRRRRRRGGRETEGHPDGSDTGLVPSDEAGSEDDASEDEPGAGAIGEAAVAEAASDGADSGEGAPAKKRGRGRRSAKTESKVATGLEVIDDDLTDSDGQTGLFEEEKPKRKRTSRSRRRKSGEEAAGNRTVDETVVAEATEPKAAGGDLGMLGESADEPVVEKEASGQALETARDDSNGTGTELKPWDAGFEVLDHPNRADERGDRVDVAGGSGDGAEMVAEAAPLEDRRPAEGGMDAPDAAGVSPGTDEGRKMSSEAGSESAPEPDSESAAKPKRRGWWLLDR